MLNNHHSSNDTKTIIMPCCYDGLTAKLIESAGFDLTFMTGFGVAATYGLPDAGTRLFDWLIDCVID
jgi:2-methylisocitrate lyase-like PEP mutase family enzyme